VKYELVNFELVDELVAGVLVANRPQPCTPEEIAPVMGSSTSEVVEALERLSLAGRVRAIGQTPRRDTPRACARNDELIHAFVEMRQLQRTWHGGERSKALFSAMKMAEKRVDILLGDALNTAQGKLF